MAYNIILMGKFWENSESKMLYWTEKQVQPKQWSSDADAAFYHTKAWRNVRRIYITNNPFCEKCMLQNKAVNGDVVDHIKPIRFGGEPLDMDNLQTLCKHCHNSKSAKERHERT